MVAEAVAHLWEEDHQAEGEAVVVEEVVEEGK